MQIRHIRPICVPNYRLKRTQIKRFRRFLTKNCGIADLRRSISALNFNSVLICQLANPPTHQSTNPPIHQSTPEVRSSLGACGNSPIHQFTNSPIHPRGLFPTRGLRQFTNSPIEASSRPAAIHQSTHRGKLEACGNSPIHQSTNSLIH